MLVGFYAIVSNMKFEIVSKDTTFIYFIDFPDSGNFQAL